MFLKLEQKKNQTYKTKQQTSRMLKKAKTNNQKNCLNNFFNANEKSKHNLKNNNANKINIYK